MEQDPISTRYRLLHDSTRIAADGLLGHQCWHWAYWIVHPLDETITVLALDGDAYATHGVFRRGEKATSRLLDGFAVSVDAALDAR